MRYLLDTNICIYIAKKQPPEVEARFAVLRPGEVGMSVITWGELRYGAQRSQHAQVAAAKLDALRELIPVCPLSAETADHYGRLRAFLQQAGTPIGANDLWIAAHALDLDLTLVSNNLREFNRIPALRQENWAT